MKKNFIKRSLMLIPMACLCLSCHGAKAVIETVQHEFIPIRQIYQGVDEQGFKYQTFSYQILPEDTTNKDVIVSLMWSREYEEDINNYLKISHNDEEMTVTITLLKKANVQAIVEIEHIDTGLLGSVYIDFYKDHLGFSETEYKYAYPVSLKNNDKFLSTSQIIEQIENRSLGLGPGTVLKAELETTIDEIVRQYDESLTFFEFVDGEITTQQEQYWYFEFAENVNMLENGVESFTGLNSLDLFLESNVLDDFRNMSNDLKRMVRSYTYLGFYNKYEVTFNHYDLVGQTHTIEIMQYFPVADLIEYLNINPTEIVVSDTNIIF